DLDRDHLELDPRVSIEAVHPLADPVVSVVAHRVDRLPCEKWADGDIGVAHPDHHVGPSVIKRGEPPLDELADLLRVDADQPALRCRRARAIAASIRRSGSTFAIGPRNLASRPTR